MIISPHKRRSPSRLFRRRSRRRSRIYRWHAAASNWLNGLPVPEDDEAETQSLQGTLHCSSGAFAERIRPRNWFGRGGKKSGAAAVAAAPGGADCVAASRPQQRALEAAPQGSDNRQPVRIIQLPPEPASYASRVHKRDDLNSATVTNEIRTAKYTFLNFLPKNLLEHMRRVANIYFVLIVFLQFFPAISNYSPILSALPITVILSITSIKDAIEDWRRHQQDDEVNYSICMTLNRPDAERVVSRDTRWRRLVEVLQGWLGAAHCRLLRLLAKLRRRPFEVDGRYKALQKVSEDAVAWKETFWREVRVGDIVLLKNNERIPADIMILSTSEQDGVCFVETKNLDGETNLKIRHSPYEMEWIKGPEDAYNVKATIEVELPNTNLYSFHGRIIVAKDIPSPIKDDCDFGGASSREELLAVSYSKPAGTDPDGTAFVEPTVIPVSNNGLLLRGCILRNTAHVIGVVVYTGPHSKLMMNSGGTPSKRTRMERQMNPQIILNFLLLFVICLCCAVIQAQVAETSQAAPFWVLINSSAFLGFLTFWSSLILFQTLVPLSMYVTVEIVKTIQAYFINNDVQMYHRETNRRAVPRAWNLSDDLGQIEYLFSDKTGTLTQNVMEFRRCSIAGRAYGFVLSSPSSSSNNMPAVSLAIASSWVDEEKWDVLEQAMTRQLFDLLPYHYVPPTRFSFVDPGLFQDVLADAEQRERITSFFLLIIVCHTVLIDSQISTIQISDSQDGADDDSVCGSKGSSEIQPHNLLFKSQSPDEAALVAAARDLGFVFLGRDKDVIFVSVLGQIEAIHVMNVIEFSSSRKRMSTIVRRQGGEIVLLCKGADNVVFERLSASSALSEVAKLTQSHLENFAEDGLRTLCLAHRTLADEEYHEWVSKYSEACAAVNNRDLLIDAASDEIERELTLLGATAIEDRLQEGVPECIEVLQKAGIKVWVLTGDKMETAINIGFSCRLLRKDMFLLVIGGDSPEETFTQLKNAYEKIWSRYFCFGAATGEEGISAETSFAMIIEGSTLKHALDKTCKSFFIDLSSRCDAVICCRVSPLQKAKVVELVRRGQNAMTMAIGDGANDVSMIQAADIGVGIAGQEGMQAVMSSDYSISQFRFLTRLLLVHGRWSYLRVAQVTLCSLYKNVAFVVLLFWYQFYCGFTAQYIYDYMYLLFFNLFFSILPLLLLGGFERDLPDNYLVRVPPIYRLGIKQTSYSMKLFLWYIAIAMYQSIVCFFVPLLVYQDKVITYRGLPESQTLLGNVMALSIITCTNLFMALNTFSWVWAMLVGLFLTVVTLFGFLLVYALIPSQRLYGSWVIFIDPVFWATFLLCLTLALLPWCLIRYVQTIVCPSDLDIVREIKKWRIGEAGLLRSVAACGEGSRRIGQWWGVGAGPAGASAGWGGQEEVIAVPPRAAHRSSPRKLLGMELVEEQPMLLEPQAALEQPGQAFAKTRGARLLKKSLRLFNLRTDRFEKMNGYAFSQEDGMGEIIVQRSRPPGLAPPAFGAVFLKNTSGPVLHQHSADPDDLPTPAIPGAVAQRGSILRRRRHWRSGSIKKLGTG